ncbi:hypothetical protein RD792_008795 [Penstemon davidsonii]|uniref:C3H1-type domain-containing protein n=1 Tax=Penstemon davidsonii TaxID=160366 RepID=A0ABR0DA45_9LAMI|nr:hypothetical protein RD792_008795 [Penstemon davidsonii]
MAESPTSEEPPIAKLGIGLLIPNTTPSGLISTDHGDSIHPSESEGNDSAVEENKKLDVELRNAVEREIYQLSIEQAEIEAVGERFEAEIVGSDYLDEEKNEIPTKTVRRDELDEENSEKDARSVEEETEKEGSVGGQLVEERTELGRYYHGNNRRWINYPMRPDADDCSYYMKFGSCKFGLNCKFNHPPRKKNQLVIGKINKMLPSGTENDFMIRRDFDQLVIGKINKMLPSGTENDFMIRRDFDQLFNCEFGQSAKGKGFKEKSTRMEENSEKAGQTECKYYLTSGGCKYGKNCKFSHGSDKSFILPNKPEFNFLGLPIRLGEKECQYYMRNGSCMYGSNCRFHHPDPTTVAGGDSSGYGNGKYLPSQIVPSDASSWSSPRAFSDTSPFGPVMFPQTQGAPNPYPDWDEYEADDYPTSGTSLPTPPAFAINNIPTEINFTMQIQEYPERPGEPECSFFLRTGVCKFRSSCKFHHPKKTKPKENSFSLSDIGLPLRPVVEGWAEKVAVGMNFGGLWWRPRRRCRRLREKVVAAEGGDKGANRRCCLEVGGAGRGGGGCLAGLGMRKKKIG